MLLRMRSQACALARLAMRQACTQAGRAARGADQIASASYHCRPDPKAGAVGPREARVHVRRPPWHRVHPRRSQPARRAPRLSPRRSPYACNGKVPTDGKDGRLRVVMCLPAPHTPREAPTQATNCPHSQRHAYSKDTGKRCRPPPTRATPRAETRTPRRPVRQDTPPQPTRPLPRPPVAHVQVRAAETRPSNVLMSATARSQARQTRTGMQQAEDSGM